MKNNMKKYISLIYVFVFAFIMISLFNHSVSINTNLLVNNNFMINETFIPDLKEGNTSDITVSIIEKGNFKYEASTSSEVDDVSYKWYINNELQTTTDKLITIDVPVSNITLKTEVYSLDVLIGSNEITVNKVILDFLINKRETDNNEVFYVSADKVDMTHPIISDYNFEWYELEGINITKLDNSTYELPIENPKDGYKVIITSKSDSSYKKELVYYNEEINYIFVDYTNGNNNNDGKTKATAIKTLEKAYELLRSDLPRERQFLIIVGYYSGTYQSINESNTKGLKPTVYTKPATITGIFYGTNYSGKLKLLNNIGMDENVTNQGNYLYANTTFTNIELTGTGTTYLVCQGRDLTMDENVKMSGFTYNTAADTGTGVVAGGRLEFHVIAGWQSYQPHVTRRDETTNIVIKSGVYSRIILANRMGVARAAMRVGFTKDKPFNVKLTVDIKEPDPDSRYTYDINSLYGGNGEGTIYMNSEIDLINGRIGRYTGGSRGNDVNDASVPGNTFFGSTILNMSGGTINEFFGASLGSARASNTSGYNGYSGNYQYGKIDINISGGTINSIFYGSGGGAVTGYSDSTDDKYKSLAKGQTMVDMYGNTYPLDDMKLNINISGGTFNKDFYIGGYGSSDRIEAKQLTKDGGYLYGDATLNITGGTFNGDIYGGGQGYENYGTDRPNLASHVGNTEINITGSPIINGTIYGGGQGISTFPNMAKVIGDVNINIDSPSLSMANEIYGGGAIGKVDGDINLSVNMNSVNNIYGGGSAGDVTGSVVMDVNDTNVSGNIYGGGKSGSVLETVEMTLNNSTANEVFGGGYSKNVGESLKTGIVSKVIVLSGTYGNIFGGGDLGQIFGDTYVSIGTVETSTTITGIAYGGGRGSSSEFETVKGDSNVYITGIDTNVENYGSTKLGKVDGDVYLKFIDYYVDNPTSKYKRMNGIDRATTVEFSNSYVLLENLVNGELKGIEDIENIILPSHSGLKISANGTITGDFTGGGELYLDSEVCLTVLGSISNRTTLILNPQLQKISGGIENPYMIVYKNSEATSSEEEATRLVSGDSLYVILTQKSDLTENHTYYYINDDVEIEDFLIQKSVNIEDKVYNGIIEDNLYDISILNTDAFTNLLRITYNYLDDGSKNGKFDNIIKVISLKNTTSKIKFPINTEITMIDPNGNYYYYLVDSEIEDIDLSEFISYSDGSRYVNVFNISDITDPAYVETNPVNGNKTYDYTEAYRFIVNLSNSSERLDTGNYYINMDFSNATEDLNKELETNVVKVKERNFAYDGETEFKQNLSNEVINVSGIMNVGGLDSKTYLQKTNLKAKVTILDSNKNNVTIPDDTKIIRNGNVYDVYNGVIDALLLEDLNLSSDTAKELDFTLDMTDVLPQNRLTTGSYYVLLDLYYAYEDIRDMVSVGTIEVPVNIFSIHGENGGSTYGLKADMVKDSKIPKLKVKDDKNKIITLGNLEERTINVNYEGSFVNTKINIFAVKKINSFDYEATNNSNNNIVIDTKTIDLNNLTSLNENINVRFRSNLTEGTYRIMVQLVSEDGTVLIEDFVNFIVVNEE